MRVSNILGLSTSKFLCGTADDVVKFFEQDSVKLHGNFFFFEHELSSELLLDGTCAGITVTSSSL
jgi:hypothetical protein